MSPPNKQPAFFSSPTTGTSNALYSMNMNRTLRGDRRDGSSNSDDRFNSILAGMRAISNPNGEPRRSTLEILDDAIALEDNYQRQQRGAAPRRRDPREDGAGGKTTKQ